MRTHSDAFPEPGMPVSSQYGQRVGELGLEAIHDRSLMTVHQRARRAIGRRRNIGTGRPLAAERPGPPAERAQDREDLAIADVRDHARLADLMTAHGLDDIELEHRRRARERKELRGRPDARSPGHLFHHLDGRTQSAAPEQRAGAGDQTRDHGEPPRVRIGRRFDPEKREGIHRRRRLSGRNLCAVGGAI